MKLAPFILASATALETSSTAETLLAAVGHRNVTKMEALIQNLAEESISEPAWKFDDDIKKALHAIRDMFVKSIQTALNDAHKHDQEDFNCFVEECFGKCNNMYRETTGHCHHMEHKCHGLGHAHGECRVTVYGAYKEMAKSCAALHCFEIPDPPCVPEDCLCPDLSYCHRAPRIAELSIAYPGEEPAYPVPEEPGYPVDSHCEARAGHCNGKFGGWLQGQIIRYQSAYAEWVKLYDKCKTDYHAFLTVDMDCDRTQKEFEKCLCEKNSCEFTTCSINFEQCKEQCWGEYEIHVHEKECLEKDRKIDWSATKKIECYIDVLLHDYTKEELLTKCGSETCVNVAREADYKHCATICPQVDHDGEWPNVECVDKSSGKIAIDNHAHREHHDQYHLGDGDYKCDANGPNVMTRHRGGVARIGEMRCTEHLDIDYQIPEVGCCDPRSPPVCDEKFHWTWYAKFDDVTRIGCINECCPEQSGTTCFPHESIDTSYDGHTMEWITVTEHSHAWAYNRCRCTECIDGYPSYPEPPAGRECGMGAHTLSRNGVYEPAKPQLGSGMPSIQAAWDNHFGAFGNQDLDQIMLDYTESSVLTMYQFPSGAEERAEGLAQIRNFFEHLFSYLSDTSELAAPVIDVGGTEASPARQVFLVWRAPSSNIYSATDSFLFAPDNTIMRQYIVTSEGTAPPAYNDVFTVNMPPTQNAIAPLSASYRPSQQEAYDNHWDAIDELDINKLMQDYTDESEVSSFNHANGVLTIARGRAQIQSCFEALFGILSSPSHIFIERSVNQPEGKAVFVVWNVPGIITSGADVFIYNEQNKVIRQNIVFTTGSL